ncbi:hypothetical protein BDZ45DRAFT_448320 [Acephala macrosclerotiorum]|nr:hypothetical protein BDZ45DRAFT_448320 [Acephala macrosclerotiorum]
MKYQKTLRSRELPNSVTPFEAHRILLSSRDRQHRFIISNFNHESTSPTAVLYLYGLLLDTRFQTQQHSNPYLTMAQRSAFDVWFDGTFNNIAPSYVHRWRCLETTELRNRNRRTRFSCHESGCTFRTWRIRRLIRHRIQHVGRRLQEGNENGEP